MRISDWSSDVCSSDLKMVSRHPHVFGDHRADTPDAVKVTWEAQKEAERAAKAARENGGGGQPPGALDGVTAALPALDRKSVVSGKSVSVRVDLGGRRNIKKQQTKRSHPTT